MDVTSEDGPITAWRTSEDHVGQRPPHRHFGFLSDEVSEDLFHRQPEPFRPTSEQEMVAYSLGATLYTPGTHPRLADRLVAGAERGVTSSVICLEDAIADDQVEEAEHNVVRQLRELEVTRQTLPLVFVRTRRPDQIIAMAEQLGPALGLLSGFVLPKFLSDTGEEWFAAIDQVAAMTPQPLYAMPVLEASRVLHTETRREELEASAELLDAHRHRVLVVRTGIADLCGLLGLRRSPFETIYDIAPVRDCLADIANVFLRLSRGYVVSAGVWEYFQQDERLFRPLLRHTVFEEQTHGGETLRRQLLHDHMDGLMTEVQRDLANGLLGKTVVHPSHVHIVNAMHAVTHEQWDDAQAILGRSAGGALASSYGNKMNEAGPHRPWAERMCSRARAFGVLREGVPRMRLLDACQVA